MASASPESIAAAAGLDAVKVSRYWPVIVRALQAEGIDSPNVETAAAATIATETPTFTPVAERGALSYFDKYEPGTSIGKSLGNTQPGDGYKYRGRGFIQLTGRSNYTAMSKRLGIDLVNNPDLALDAYHAARIFAAYFKDRGVATAANNGDWERVRRLVNGGLNGWDRFIGVVNGIAASAATAITPINEKGETNPLFLALLAGGLLLLLGLRK